MVSQLSRVNLVKPSFDYIKDIYEVCLQKHLNNKSITFDSINRGRKILTFEQEVDAYIAFYGSHHYYKLLEAFNALNISQFRDRQIDIISYGCGAATDTCSLISYCRSQQISLPFKNLTLIEPSQIALNRGIEYIDRALSSTELSQINIKEIYKPLDELEKYDLYCDRENLKLHIFSNVLDIQAIDLDSLSQLIYDTRSGTDYFICINPYNQASKTRIDSFYNKLSKVLNLLDIDKDDSDIIDKQIYRMTDRQYSNQYPICRYHRIFKTN